MVTLASSLYHFICPSLTHSLTDSVTGLTPPPTIWLCAENFINKNNICLAVCTLNAIADHALKSCGTVKYAWYTAGRDLNSRKCLRGPHRTSSNLYC